MELRPFRHATAESLEEAASLLAEDGSRPVAGGTDLLGVLRDNIHHPDYPSLLVDLKRIPGLDRIRDDGRRLRVGSLVTLADLAGHEAVRGHYPALAEAARAVAGPQVRNMATVGGNLCQEPRCWYYRHPENRFDCSRKGGNGCPAMSGENRYHSIFGAMRAIDPPCGRDCPAHVDIAGYLARLREGDRDGAARMVLERNPLPAITGRVCPHYCEAGCNRSHYDAAVSVRAVERGIGDHVLDHPARFYRAPRRSSGRHVAVVGSGPAGLAAAYYLRLLGHEITVYEALAQPGGMLTYGIPAYRLPAEVVRRQVAALEGMGITFCLNARIGGRGLSLATLRRRHAAVFLATGTWVPRRLGLAGEELLDQGLDLLRNVREGHRPAVGRRVLVIGGGSVALDVAISAARLGAEHVTVACLEARDTMPAFSEDVEQALAEKVEILPSWGPHRVLARRGALTGVELARCTAVFDATGRFAPVLDKRERCTIAADQVFLAIGQQADLAYAPAALRRGAGLAVSPDGTTALPGVFAGGDAVGGSATVVAAIAAGRRAALAINAHLGGRGRVARPGGNGHVAANPDALPLSPPLELAHRPGGQRSLEDEDRVSPAWDAVASESRRCFNCGGCAAVNASDLAPVLLALEATIHTDRRAIPAERFFAIGPRRTTSLAPGEMVTEVTLPRPPAGTRQCYLKFRTRRSIDFPITGVAAVVSMADGVVTRARLALGAVAPIPLRATAAEGHLAGRRLDARTAARAAALAVADAEPLRENRWKVTVLETLVRRALAGLASRR